MASNHVSMALLVLKNDLSSSLSIMERYALQKFLSRHTHCSVLSLRKRKEEGKQASKRGNTMNQLENERENENT